MSIKLERLRVHVKLYEDVMCLLSHSTVKYRLHTKGYSEMYSRVGRSASKREE